jgi:hypothetical protein
MLKFINVGNQSTVSDRSAGTADLQRHSVVSISILRDVVKDL